VSTANPPPTSTRPVVQRFDAEACRDFLRFLIDPALGCAEIRILEATVEPRNNWVVPEETYSRTIAVWGDDVEDLVAEAGRIHGVSAYVTVNPVDPALKARANRLTKAKATSKDKDVTRLRFLYLDADPVRPDGISSTNEERMAAAVRIDRILADHPGFAASSIRGCSGNGSWLLVRLPDLPNDEAHRALIARVTDWFAASYSDELVKIDEKTKNPARIMPLVGTIKCKGISTPERPHRPATLASPRGHDPVPFDLEAWAAIHVPVEQPAAAQGNGKPAGPAPASPGTTDLRTRAGRWTPAERARAYVFSPGFPDSIAGQRGHDALYRVACVLVDGFGLPEQEASPIFQEWNQAKAQPPESDAQIRHKLADAIRNHPTPSLKQLNEGRGGGSNRGNTAGPSPSANGDGAHQGGEIKDGRPEILVTHEEHRAVDEAVQALRSAPLLFQRGGALVTIHRECKPKPKRYHPARPPGSLRIAMLPNAQIRRLMSLHAAWIKWRKDRHGKLELVPVPPPATIVEELATLGAWPGIRPIEGITECPTLRPDGSLISIPGYDEETGLWYEPNGEFPAIPDCPTLAEARSAVEALYNVVADFPFAEEQHKSVWLAALLTPMARWAIDGPCPLFLFDANCPGTGKSKLCDIIAILTTGREMARGDYPDEQDEMQKMLLSVAMAADRLLLFDNVSTGFSIGGSALDRALTARTMKGRILGKSQMTPELAVDVVFYATGNNLGLRGDALRRVIPCRLETIEERPEERKDFRITRACPCGCRGILLAHVKDARGELVAAGLTILRGFIEAGCPDQDLTPMDYPAWSRLIRGAVYWATEVDPCEGRKDLVTNDEETSLHRAIVDGWSGLCASADKTALTAAQAVAAIEQHGDQHPAIQDVFLGWSRDGKLPSSRSVGNHLNKIKGRNIGGKALCCTSSAIREWYVKPIAPQSVSGSGGSSGSCYPPSRAICTSDNCRVINGEQRGQAEPPEAPEPLIPPDGIDWCDQDPNPF
jgi:hypothetical protein